MSEIKGYVVLGPKLTDVIVIDRDDRLADVREYVLRREYVIGKTTYIVLGFISIM